MAIFSRRTIQKLIKENSSFLSHRQLKEIVNRLNRMPQEMTLSHEWEIVILNAFSKVGKVEYEKDFGGRTKPDIYFEVNNGNHFNFVADITAVSDKGLDVKNPYEALHAVLHKIIREHGLTNNSFHLQVGKREGRIFKDGPKVELKLPGSSMFSQKIFNKDFFKFLSIIKKNPGNIYQFILDTADANLLIEYNPKKDGATGNYPSFKELTHLYENNIYSTLTDKASQLSKIGPMYSGPLGIFLCNGGSNFFSKNSPSWYSYSIDDIIKTFLNHNTDIIFVITIDIETKWFYYRDKNIFVITKIYPGININNFSLPLNNILNRAIEKFPKPQNDPQNALNLLKGKYPHYGNSFFGGLELRPGMKHTRIKISARALLELLGGRVSIENFIESHGLASSIEKNYFDYLLKEGQLIKNIFIEKSEDDDDDWLLIELEGPDPAISPFVVNNGKDKHKK